MKTYAGRLFETYEVSGQEIRIHWDIQKTDRQDMDGNPIDEWSANEAVVSTADSRNQVIEKIIGSVYSTGAELAVINNKDIDPAAYAEYQDFRVQAKQLADGWLNKE